MKNKDITKVPSRQRNVAMIFQQYSLFPTMTVYANIAFGLKIKKMDKKEIGNAVTEALHMVGLNGSEKKYPSQLSGGEQQRVALARNLATRPTVLLLDEPFSAIDAKLRKELQIRIKEIHHQLNMTSVFVTHDQEEAMRMSDIIHLINEGRIEQSGLPLELYASPATSFAASFIGSYNILDAQDFSEMVAACYDSSRKIMIRPEAITLSDIPFPAKCVNFHYLEGTISNQIPQGNIIKYTVNIKEKTLDIDILFHNAVSYGLNQKVYLKISKDDILSFS